MFRHAYCPDCDALVDMELIRTHNLGSHPDDWLTLTWNRPLSFPAEPVGDVSQQLDRVSQHLDEVAARLASDESSSD